MFNNENKMLKILILTFITLGLLTSFYLAYYHVFPALHVIFIYTYRVFIPFTLALIISIILEPLIALIEKRTRLSRGLSVLLAMTILFGLLTTGIVWAIIRLTLEVIKFINYLPHFSSALTVDVLNLINKSVIFYSTLDIPENILQNINTNVVKLINKFSSFSIDFLSELLAFISNIPNGLIIAFFTILTTFFISRDKDKILTSLKRILPNKIGLVIDSVMAEMVKAIFGFIQAQFVLIFITFLQTLLGFYFLKIPYALLIAIVVAIADILPILGPGAVFVPWILWEFATGDYNFGLALLVLYIFISTVRNILQPKIVSDSIGMHPIETLISIYVGLKIFGVLGVIVGPLLLVTLKAIWKGCKNLDV